MVPGNDQRDPQRGAATRLVRSRVDTFCSTPNCVLAGCVAKALQLHATLMLMFRYGQKYWEHWKYGVAAFVIFPIVGAVVGVLASWIGI